MRKKAHKLEFISLVNRDGSGVELLSDDSTYLFLKRDKIKMKLFRLSITNDTYMATDNMNWFVVRISSVPCKEIAIAQKIVLPTDEWIQAFNPDARAGAMVTLDKIKHLNGID